MIQGVMISKATRVDDCVYTDLKGGSVKVDFSNLTITKIDASLDCADADDPWKTALEEYVRLQYGDKARSTVVSIELDIGKVDEITQSEQIPEDVVSEEDIGMKSEQAEQQDTQANADSMDPAASEVKSNSDTTNSPFIPKEFIISAPLSVAKSMYSAMWISSFKLYKEEDACMLSGKAKINVLYYESSTSSLNADYIKSISIPESIASNPESIVKAITKIENDWQADLHRHYHADVGPLTDSALRKLRRYMPLTRQAIDWEKV